MARSASQDWMSHLPLVLLGVRASVREDSGTSPAELLYGAVLRLPGQMLSAPSAGDSRPSSEFVRDLQDRMKVAVPMPVLYHNKNRQSHLPVELRTSSHVFVRIDAVKPPLTRPYEGPFEVLSRSDDLKTFTLDRAGRSWVVSVDRLKPAFSHSDSPGTSSSLPFGALAHASPSPPSGVVLGAFPALPAGRGAPEDLPAVDVAPPYVDPAVDPAVDVRVPSVQAVPEADADAVARDEQAVQDADIGDVAPAPVQTRSGRVSRPPTRL